ncbi:MAG: FitA-like ribbon-helix-helix domain-containing protein [Microcystis aeruginosa]
MTTLILENLPNELIEQIKQLAQQHNQSVNEQVISILKQALQKPQTPLKFLISPETDPTWEERRKATPEILAEIEQRRQQRQTAIQWLDSTALIREDRDNR